MSTLTLKPCEFLPCISCHAPMDGIKSYEIRRVCEECGGKATDSKPGG